MNALECLAQSVSYEAIKGLILIHLCFHSFHSLALSFFLFRLSPASLSFSMSQTSSIVVFDIKQRLIYQFSQAKVNQRLAYVALS